MVTTGEAISGEKQHGLGESQLRIRFVTRFQLLNSIQPRFRDRFRRVGMKVHTRAVFKRLG
jgi:hypothetical protein